MLLLSFLRLYWGTVQQMSELHFVNSRGNAQFEEMSLTFIFGLNPEETEHRP